MEMNFDNLGTIETGAETVAVPEAKADVTKDIKKNFRNKLEANPELREALYSKSGTIEVVKACGYGDNAGLIQTNKGTVVKDADGKPVRENVNGKNKVKVEGRTLEATSQIVGYIIKNIGSEPIKFANGVWKKGADGVYVEEEIEDVLNPGDQKPITRKYLTILAVRPEYSLKFSNGKMVGSSSTKRYLESGNLEGILATYHFTLADKSKSVHDDMFKVAIATPEKVSVNGVESKIWHLLPEYEATFGYLSNPKVKKTRGVTKTEDGKDIGVAAFADFVNGLIQQKM